jgi:hypothetical protein
MAALVPAHHTVSVGDGAVAQLGERRNRTAEVVSSNLIGSTILVLQIRDTFVVFREGQRPNDAAQPCSG